MTRKQKIEKLLKRSNLLILLGTTTLYLIIIGLLMRSLTTKSYLMAAKDLVAIENVRVMIGPNYVKPRNGSFYEFGNDLQKMFRISGSAETAMEDVSEFLQFASDTSVSLLVLTDRKGLENYTDPESDDPTYLYGVEIKGKQYISLIKLNRKERDKRYHLIWFCSIWFLIFLWIHFSRIWGGVHSTAHS